MTEERFLRVNKKSREALFALDSEIQWGLLLLVFVGHKGSGSLACF